MIISQRLKIDMDRPVGNGMKLHFLEQGTMRSTVHFKLNNLASTYSQNFLNFKIVNGKMNILINFGAIEYTRNAHSIAQCLCDVAANFSCFPVQVYNFWSRHNA